MDLTAEFEALTATRGQARNKRYTSLDDATRLVASINKFKTYLTNCGHHYLNTYGILQGTSLMTDERRNKLDRQIEEFIGQCRETMQVLRSEIRLNTTSAQVIEHRTAVIEMVMRILNDFVNYSTKLQTTRVQRTTEKERMGRIVRNNLYYSSRLKEDDPILSLEDTARDLEDKLLTSISSKESSTAGQGGLSLSQNYSIDEHDYRQQSLIASEHDAELSQQEFVMLVKENSIIHDELTTFRDEVQLLHRKVNQISKLQEMFREKVQEQDIELNEVHEIAVQSSENIKGGNEQIREAMQKNASWRALFLIYVITLGFTILFLDWYNP